MPYEVEAFGKIIEVPDDMPKHEAYKIIMANRHKLDPDYKPDTATSTGGTRDFLEKNFLGFSTREQPSIADQAEATADEGANTAAPQVKGAPVRQSFYNKALLNNDIGSQESSGVLARTRKAADEDIKGQDLQRELEGLRTDGNVPEGGFIASAKTMAGQTIKGAGQMGADYLGYDKDNALIQYGNEIIRENPVVVKSLTDIKDQPFMAFKEASGNMVPSFGGMIATAALGQGIISVAPLTGPLAPVVAAVGAGVKWLGPAAIAALPSYSGIRDKQIFNDPKNEESEKAKAIALLGASAVGAIETAFGPQNWAISMMTKEGRSALARKFAATTPAGAFLKGGLRGAAVEGSEELVQNPIEQLASFDNPTTKENIEETLFGGAMGAIGGFVPGGVTNTAANISNQAQSKADRINAERAKLGLDKIVKSETVDQAINAANESVSQKPVDKDDVLRVADPTLADIERLTGLKPSETLQTAQDELQRQSQAAQQNITTGSDTEPSQTLRKTASWVIVDKNNNEALFETYDKNKVDALNTERYKAVPILEYLQGLNKNNKGGQPSGSDTEIVLPDNKTLKARWDVVDADNVKASLRNGVSQPRDRTRAASDVQIQEIANQPDYRRLADSPVMDIGAPVISVDGQIVGGNGRFEALSRAYDQGTHKDYLERLKQDVINKGIDPAILDTMRKPVLVRRISEPFDTRQLAIASNSGMSAAYSDLEQAKIDAERLKGIDEIITADNGDIVMTGDNVRRVRDALGGYNAAEIASFVDDQGQLSQQGIKRIRNAMLAKAYGDNPVLGKIIESTDSDIKTILGSLTRVAGDVVKAMATAPKESDITPNLLDAINIFSQLKQKGQSVTNYLSQQDAFTEKLDPVTENVLLFLDKNSRSQPKVTQYIRDAYTKQGAIDATSPDIFGQEPPKVKDIFAKPTIEEELEKHLKKNGYNFDVRPIDQRDINALDDTKKAQKDIAEKQAKIFNKKIIFVKAKGEFGINGVMVPAIKDTIFINIETPKPFHAVMAHELSHWMEQEHPSVYKDMLGSLKDVIVNEEGYRKKYGITEQDEGLIQKEIAADLMGDNFTDENFWNKVAAANPDKWKEIAKRIIQWLKNTILKAKSRGMGSEEWVTDAKKAQDIIANAVAQYTKQQDAVGKDIKFHKAFHGSPHDHNKFDSSKIGTGEGAQAYGFGHYFAESKDVAEYYKKTLENIKPAKYSIDGVEEFVVHNDWKAMYLQSAVDGTLPQHIKNIEPASKKDPSLAIELDYAKSLLGKNVSVVEGSKTAGKLYEVELAPEQDEYLLWDKPLSEQPEFIKNIAFKEYGFTDNDIERAKYSPARASYISEKMSGTGQTLYTKLAAEKRSQKAASEYLHSLGIRGIKYLDGSSRAKGEGAYNYVIFDDNDVSITAKFSRANEDYRMEHQSPGREGNAPLSDLTGDGNIYPEDVYSNKAVQYYGTGDNVMDKQSFTKAKSYRGKPDAIVEVYRAVPKGVSDTINPGDWVTINRNYAKEHGESYFDGNYDILSKKVRARDIFTNGDSIHEWGYEPEDGVKFSKQENPPDTITIDGTERPTRNSEGKLIHPTEEGIRNFWKWFGDGYLTDVNGRPSILYHQTSIESSDNIYKEGFRIDKPRARKSDPRVVDGIFFKPSPDNIGLGSSNENDIDQIPVYLNIKNPLVANTAEEVGDIVNDKIYLGLLRDVEIADANLAKEFDDKWKSKNLDRVKFKEFTEEFFPRSNSIINDLAGKARERLTEVVSNKGYDGVIIISDKGSFGRTTRTIIALNPNQIKSAIENNGEFSESSNDIRFSQQKPFNPNEDIPETFARKIQRKFQDKFNRFNVVKEYLEKEEGIKISENADVYGAEERYHAKVANQHEDFRNKVRNPLVEKIAKAGFKLDDVEQYLLNRHAQEANLQNRKLTGKDDSTAYGISDEDAKAYLAKAPKELAKLADEIQAITKATQQLRLDNGIENQERIDAMNAAYQYYVPVRGGAEEQAKQQGYGKGLSVKYKPKRRLGHELRNESVIENIFQDYERAIIEVEKNRVGKSLALMAAEIQMPELISINQPVKRKVLRNEKAYGVLVKGELQDVFQTEEAAKQNRQLLVAADKKLTLSDVTIAPITDQRLIYNASPMLADNEVLVYMDGHEVRLQINDELLAQAYKNMGMEPLGSILSVGRAINGWMSKVYTAYNPEFFAVNILRDFTSGMINLTGEQGIGISAKAIANYPKAFSSLLKYATTGQSDRWIYAYRDNGGNTGAAYLSDLERLGEEVRKEYASYQGVIANLKEKDVANALRAAGRKVFNATIRYMENLNQAGENAFRLATFKAMVESGKSAKESGSMAKNVTVNFNRKGEIGAELNALYLFFNASIQGTAAASHALFKGRNKYQAWGLAGSMMTLGYIAASMLGGFDDEDEYDSISDFVKSRNLIISYGDGYVKIPVPYGHGFFYNAGRMYAEAQRKDEIGKLPYQLAALATEEFSPFNIAQSEDSSFDSRKVTYGLIPTAIRIPVEITNNYSTFTGRELYPEKAWYKSEPDNEKMFRGTKGTVYDVSAQYLASIGVEISPETLKYLSRTATGGAGAFIDSTVSAAMLKKQGAELDTREIPFVRKFYGEATIQDARARYNKAKEEAREAYEKFNALRKKNDLVSVRNYLNDKKELIALNSYANKMSDVIKNIRDQQDLIKLSEDFTVAEKRLKIKELEKQEEYYYDLFLNRHKQVKGR